MTVTNHFDTDAAGNPDGGASILHVNRLDGVEEVIVWQRGLPMEQGRNGWFVEEVIAAAKARIEYYNETKFRCRENSLAITKLDEALHWLQHRTARREAEGVEGTHEGD